MDVFLVSKKTYFALLVFMAPFGLLEKAMMCVVLAFSMGIRTCASELQSITNHLKRARDQSFSKFLFMFVLTLPMVIIVTIVAAIFIFVHFPVINLTRLLDFSIKKIMLSITAIFGKRVRLSKEDEQEIEQKIVTLKKERNDHE